MFLNSNTAYGFKHLQENLLEKLLCVYTKASSTASTVISFDQSNAGPINSCLNVVVRSPTPFGLGRNGCWPSRGSQLPQRLSFIFSLCCPLNDHRRAAHSIYKIGCLFSLFFSPALLLPFFVSSFFFFS